MLHPQTPTPTRHTPSPQPFRSARSAHSHASQLVSSHKATRRLARHWHSEAASHTFAPAHGTWHTLSILYRPTSNLDDLHFLLATPLSPLGNRLCSTIIHAHLHLHNATQAVTTKHSLAIKSLNHPIAHPLLGNRPHTAPAPTNQPTNQPPVPITYSSSTCTPSSTSTESSFSAPPLHSHIYACQRGVHHIPGGIAASRSSVPPLGPRGNNPEPRSGA